MKYCKICLERYGKKYWFQNGNCPKCGRQLPSQTNLQKSGRSSLRIRYPVSNKDGGVLGIVSHLQELAKKYEEVKGKLNQATKDGKKPKIQSGLSGHILGKPFSIGDMNTFGRTSNFGAGSIKKDNWKPTIHKKEYKPEIKATPNKQKNILVDIFDEKGNYKIVVDGTTVYNIKDKIITLGEDEWRKEVVLPEDIDLRTEKVEEKSRLLVFNFRRLKKEKK